MGTQKTFWALSYPSIILDVQYVSIKTMVLELAL